MVVEYATWEVVTSDRDAYFTWIFALGDQCRAEAGCLAYDYRVDASNPDRCSLFQAWESAEAFERHLEFPAHQQMLEGGHEWSIQDAVIHRWSEASRHEIIRRS